MKIQLPKLYHEKRNEGSKIVKITIFTKIKVTSMLKTDFGDEMC